MVYERRRRIEQWRGGVRYHIDEDFINLLMERFSYFNSFIISLFPYFLISFCLDVQVFYIYPTYKMQCINMMKQLTVHKRKTQRQGVYSMKGVLMSKRRRTNPV